MFEFPIPTNVQPPVGLQYAQRNAQIVEHGAGASLRNLESELILKADIEPLDQHSGQELPGHATGQAATVHQHRTGRIDTPGEGAHRHAVTGFVGSPIRQLVVCAQLHRAKLVRSPQRPDLHEALGAVEQAAAYTAPNVQVGPAPHCQKQQRCQRQVGIVRLVWKDFRRAAHAPPDSLHGCVSEAEIDSKLNTLSRFDEPLGSIDGI